MRGGLLEPLFQIPLTGRWGKEGGGPEVPQHMWLKRIPRHALIFVSYVCIMGENF